MSNQIEQIRAEIERRINNNTFGAKLALIDLLAWLDQLQTQPVPSDIQEASEITPDEGMKLVDEYVHYLATGLKEGWERPIGPKWMMEFAKKRFIAGAEWLRNKPIPEDVKEAANQYIGYPPEVDEDSATYGKRLAFAFGMLAERERMMKEEVVIDTDITINRYTKRHILHISSTDEHIQHLPQGEYKAIIIKKEK